MTSGAVQAGLHRASAFRAFLATLPAATATRIGRCPARDWQGVLGCSARRLP